MTHSFDSDERLLESAAYQFCKTCGRTEREHDKPPERAAGMHKDCPDEDGKCYMNRERDCRAFQKPEYTEWEWGLLRIAQSWPKDPWLQTEIEEIRAAVQRALDAREAATRDEDAGHIRAAFSHGEDGEPLAVIVSHEIENRAAEKRAGRKP